MLALMIGGEWYPLIGDPTFMGWFTVAAYVLAAWACAQAGTALRRIWQGRTLPREALFWYLWALFLSFLAINKQLDLQTWLTLAVRKVALAGGWYEQRRILQVAFMAVVLVLGAGLLALMFWLRAGRGREEGVALAGGVFLSCFIVIRAASFHHVDWLLGARLAGFKVNWLLELSGISLIGWAAFRTRLPLGPNRRRFWAR